MATVRTPSSWAERKTRMAISLRLATRSLRMVRVMARSVSTFSACYPLYDYQGEKGQDVTVRLDDIFMNCPTARPGTTPKKVVCIAIIGKEKMLPGEHHADARLDEGESRYLSCLPSPVDFGPVQHSQRGEIASRLL